MLFIAKGAYSLAIAFSVAYSPIPPHNRVVIAALLCDFVAAINADSGSNAAVPTPFIAAVAFTPLVITFTAAFTVGAALLEPFYSAPVSAASAVNEPADTFSVTYTAEIVPAIAAILAAAAIATFCAPFSPCNVTVFAAIVIAFDKSAVTADCGNKAAVVSVINVITNAPRDIHITAASAKFTVYAIVLELF
jgi:hypothetical protein